MSSAHHPSIDQVTAMMLQPKMEYTAPWWQSTHGFAARDSLWLVIGYVKEIPLSLSLYHLREVILSFPMLGLDRFNFQAKFPTIQISTFKSYQGTKCLRSIAAGWQITIAHSSENFSTNIESFLVQDPHPRSWLQARIKSECIFIYSICKYTSFEVCK